MTVPARRRSSVALGIGCVALFFLPFCCVGVVTAVLAGKALARHEWAQAGFFLLFATVFGGAGFGFLIAAWRGRDAALAAERRRAAEPERPWLWRTDWAAGRLEDTGRATAWTASLFALFWNLVAWPSAFVATRAAITGGNRAAYVALVFPVAGVGLAFWAVRALLRRVRFGASVLRLGTIPGVVGRTLEGTASVKLSEPQPMRVTLTAVRRHTSGSGDDRSTSESVLWQEVREAVPSHRAGLGRVDVAIAFAIPADAPASDPGASNDEVVWRLALHADLPGVDYDGVFEVPVFRTEASDTPLPASALPPAPRYRRPADSPIAVSQRGRSSEFYFPPARNAGAGFGLTAFFLLWTGALAGIIYLDAPIVFPIVFGLFELLLLLAVLGVWTLTTRVTVEPGALTVRSGCFGVGRARTIRGDAVRQIEVRIGMQAGGTPFYDLSLLDKAGKRRGIGGMIRDKHEAEWLAEQMRAALDGR
jgi:hypothetical protein